MERFVQSIEQRVEKLESSTTKDIKEIRQYMSDMNAKLILNDKLTEQNIATNEKLTNALQSVESTMVAIRGSIERSNEDLNKLGGKIRNVESSFNNKLSEVIENLEVVDEKTKVDLAITTKSAFQKFVTEYLGWLLSGGAIMYLMSQFMQ